MGRLFWKFFFAFLLVLLMVAAGVGTTVWLQKQHEPPFKDLAAGPRTAFMINLSSKILMHDGTDGLYKLLNTLKNENFPQVYVVNEKKEELLGRPIPEETLTHAKRIIGLNTESRIVHQLTTKKRHKYLLFVPLNQVRHDDLSSKVPSSPFIVPIMLGVLASLGCSAFLAWYFSKPIRHLRWALDAVSAGNLDTRVSPLMEKQRDEIADLGRNFDHMAQKLQHLIASQSRLLHDVSHELRSPLARLQAAIGLARQQPDKLNTSLDRMEYEVTRFDELVGELLTLSRLESGINEHFDEYFDLMELIRSIAEDARFEAETRKRHLVLSGNNEILIKGCAKLLYRAIENVIRNAIKYTPTNTSVEVTVTQYLENNQVVIRVSDFGPGIAEQYLETIFEPFFRIHTDGTGYGLGLAIARRAVEAHGGKIRALNQPHAGLCIEMTLPTQPLPQEDTNTQNLA